MRDGRVLDTLKHPITHRTFVQGDFQHTPAGNPQTRKALAPETPIRTGDLRSARTPTVVEEVAARVAFLPPTERVLLEQVLIHGWTTARLAALTGETKQQVYRRIRKLTARTLTDAFEQVTMHSEGWNGEMKSVGEAVFVRGISVKAAAVALGLTYSAAMLHARTIRALGKTGKSAHTPPRKRGAA